MSSLLWPTNMDCWFNFVNVSSYFSSLTLTLDKYGFWGSHYGRLHEFNFTRYRESTTGLPLSAILVRRFTMAMSAMLISLHQVVLRNALNQCLLQPSFSSDANLGVLHIIYQVAILLIWWKSWQFKMDCLLAEDSYHGVSLPEGLALKFWVWWLPRPWKRGDCWDSSSAHLKTICDCNYFEKYKHARSHLKNTKMVLFLCCLV